jgi:tartrate dehydrogenase/decarboxylase/D-malate dehydrogenase
MTHRVALIPGDGIGLEVVPEGVRVLKALAAQFGFTLEFTEFPYSCKHYLEHGVMMPADGIERLRPFDTILLGAVGAPNIPDHVSLWGLLIPIRRGFDQYVNLRPVRLLPGVRTPLAGRTAKDIDFVIIRENTEGEYSEVGGRLFQGTEREVAVQESVFTRVGVDRVLRYAFELARARVRKHVTSATKSEGIVYTILLGDEGFRGLAAAYPEVNSSH